MRGVWVWDRSKGKMIPKSEYVPENKSAFVIPDTMDAAVHPCTGKHIDSKSQFRKITRAHGCVEIGNEDPSVVLKNRRSDENIKASILEAFERSGH